MSDSTRLEIVFWLTLLSTIVTVLIKFFSPGTSLFVG
jgi:hypothetical protein